MTGSLPSTSPASIDASAQVFVDDLTAPMVDDDDAHHLVDVLRLRPGEPVVAADGRGAWCRCRIASRDRRASVLLEVDGPVLVSPRPHPPVTVAFAPVKGDRPEWAVQKLTELGVDTILPLRTLRSVVRWDGERQARTVDRLRRIAREAASQSRRAWLPVVGDVAAISELGGAALAEPGGGALTLAHPVVAIGPEGGWDPTELEQAAATVGLGDTVLRAETAAVTVGALLCGLRAGTVRPAI